MTALRLRYNIYQVSRDNIVLNFQIWNFFQLIRMRVRFMRWDKEKKMVHFVKYWVFFFFLKRLNIELSGYFWRFKNKGGSSLNISSITELLRSKIETVEIVDHYLSQLVRWMWNSKVQTIFAFTISRCPSANSHVVQ